MLSLFREANAMGIVLKEDEQINLKYPSVAIAGDHGDLAWLWFSNEGGGSRSGYIVEALLSY